MSEQRPRANGTELPQRNRESIHACPEESGNIKGEESEEEEPQRLEPEMGNSGGRPRSGL